MMSTYCPKCGSYPQHSNGACLCSQIHYLDATGNEFDINKALSELVSQNAQFQAERDRKQKDVDDMIVINRDLIAERDKYKWLLSNLLSFIFRDGGQYEAENGTEKAVFDAEKAIRKERTALEKCVSENESGKREYAALEDKVKRLVEVTKGLLQKSAENKEDITGTDFGKVWKAVADMEAVIK